MDKYITHINGLLPNTEKAISIEANGKNIIVTGMNGCGKTLFLNSLFDSIKSSIEPRKIQEISNLHSNISTYKQALKNKSNNKVQQDKYKNILKEFELQLANVFKINTIELEWDNHDNALDKSLQKSLVVSFFEATRQYSKNQRPQHQTLSEIKQIGKSQQISQDFSTSFETYLVAFLEAGYLAYALRNDAEQKNKVDLWLQTITYDLQYLFEDKSLQLVYNEQEKTFYINQDGKNPYTFSDLSSGYSSILKIYIDLLMKVELQDIHPKELSGIVIIDEIDAHLHVSLQKKILSFLDKSYPNIQFIVSTHSPFVLQSVDNAVIYDLSKFEQLEDLSLYSYEAIIKGLLGTTTNSNNLIDIVNELATLTPNVELNKERVEVLIEKLTLVEGQLDSKSKVVYLMAQQSIDDLGV
ncbi:AAA family ATPase [Aliivibrio fischeri]